MPVVDTDDVRLGSLGVGSAALAGCTAVLGSEPPAVEQANDPEESTDGETDDSEESADGETDDPEESADGETDDSEESASGEASDG